MNSGFLHNLDSGLHSKQLLFMTKFCRRDIHGVGQHHGEVRVLLHLRAVLGLGYVIHRMKGLDELIQKMASDNPIDLILDPDSGYVRACNPKGNVAQGLICHKNPNSLGNDPLGGPKKLVK